MNIKRDYSVLDKFKFEYKPIGFKYLFTKPEGIRKLENKLYLCEMIGKAHKGNTFYLGPEDFQCVEPWVFGMNTLEPMVISGTWGASEGLYQEPRACLRSYLDVPRMPPGSVNYIAFSPIDQMPFDPDILIITATIPHAQTLLRSIGYSTGNVICTSRVTPCFVCTEMYVAPFLNGEMNFAVTGLDLSMPLFNVLPPGLIMISVPWNLLSTMLENLEEMDVLHDDQIKSDPIHQGHQLGDGHKEWVRNRKQALRDKIKKINST